ncbi:MAG: 4a-hydroxytetrahydrobiopterin dehydratase [Rhodoferax sp.]|nr:4a-hydroxytetrahydrobiopterin dehydratase [Betaproteobacteria bacterium]NCN96448.1 4a-hydroxytetrahydrobiopterin dehydratase [Rhodoferax sp.]PIZ23752.1 MAG: pterin-4-alpha-carbinolamine dehydratase [Comamonadaceae bacterium CG_4_10_14_0_8_um_filter_57_29]PJC14833.1 MAG: pterin-4-alpha-carbinolamine dehydratase [Comamonadaceae bacterium CG_4_9_14_0_8_um_filter_57_21]NCP81213.1 4a-hydroxytetrahydrobiopterin dehydratase [Rhodoferax sp.]
MPLALINKALTATVIIAKLAKLDGWLLRGDGADVVIEKTFSFSDYPQTMVFVNAVAWLAQARNHHPELQVHFNRCTVRFQTHDVAGLSMADFECAAAVDALPGCAPPVAMLAPQP